MSEIDEIFSFMSACTGHKHAFGCEPFSGAKTLVSDIGLTDIVSHRSIRNGNNIPGACMDTTQVCDTMLPLLQKIQPGLPRTGIFIDDEDMEMFEFNVDAARAEGGALEGKVMDALSLGTLFYGMISFSNEELLFHLHPNKNAWGIKGQEMYGVEYADMFAKIFSLSCGVPSCRYWTYFPDVRGRERGGPAILPKFVREGLIEYEVTYYIRLLSVFLEVQQQQGGYPLMCAPCLLEKQMHNRFTERLSYDPERPQLNPFTVVDLGLERGPVHIDSGRTQTAGVTSHAEFTEKYIQECKRGKGVGWQSDLYEDTDRSYYLPRLPFSDIRIIYDKHNTYNGGYTVRWRNGDWDQ